MHKNDEAYLMQFRTTAVVSALLSSTDACNWQPISGIQSVKNSSGYSHLETEVDDVSDVRLYDSDFTFNQLIKDLQCISSQVLQVNTPLITTTTTTTSTTITLITITTTTTTTTITLSTSMELHG